MRLRVLVATPGYPLPESPTDGIFIHRQVLALRRAGVQCDVVRVHPARPGGVDALLRRSWWRRTWRRRLSPGSVRGAPAHELPYDRRWERDEDEVPAMATALLECIQGADPKPDVVYAQWLWPVGAACVAAGLSTGVPVAAIARGGELGAWLERSPHCGRWVDEVLRAAQLPLANCNYLRERCGERVPGSARRMEVIYNGCDAGVFRPAEDRAAARAALGIGEDERVLVFCGSLIARKGVPELMAAWDAVSTRHPRWRLLLLGGGADQESRAVLEQRSRPNVTSRGEVAPEDVVRTLQAADGSVHPSRSEGLANAVMEAMAVGLPAIASDICGHPELVTDGVDGWLVPPQDHEALVSAMDELMSDETEALRRGAAARRTILERFRPDVQAERLARLFSRLAGREA